MKYECRHCGERLEYPAEFQDHACDKKVAAELAASGSGEAGDEEKLAEQCSDEIVRLGLHPTSAKIHAFLAGRASLREEMEAERSRADQNYKAAESWQDAALKQQELGDEAEEAQIERREKVEDQLAAAQKEIGLLHEAIGQAEHREVALKSQLAAASITLRDRVLLKRTIAKLEATNARECDEKLFIWNARGRLEVLEGIICSLKEGVAADQIIEWVRARQAIERPEFDKAAEEALRPDSAKEGE